MKAILEFNLDDHDDLINHYRCTLSLNMALSLFEIDELLRSYLKHEELSESEFEKLYKIRNKFREILNNNGIDIDKIVD